MAARPKGKLEGGAVVAHDSPGVLMLEGRRGLETGRNLGCPQGVPPTQSRDAEHQCRRVQVPCPLEDGHLAHRGSPSQRCVFDHSRSKKETARHPVRPVGRHGFERRTGLLMTSRLHVLGTSVKVVLATWHLRRSLSWVTNPTLPALLGVTLSECCCSQCRSVPLAPFRDMPPTSRAPRV